MALSEPKIPERFECVRGRGPHLQLQFVIKRDGATFMSERAYIFRNDKDKLEDLKIYPTENKEYGLDVPEGTIGMMMFGLQYIYNDRDEMDCEFNPNEKTYPGSKIYTLHCPKFVSFGVKMNNTLNKAIQEYNSKLFSSVDFTEDKKKITSITLNESLAKIMNPADVASERYAEVLATEYLKRNM
jgi:hypothetical protein